MLLTAASSFAQTRNPATEVQHAQALRRDGDLLGAIRVLEVLVKDAPGGKTRLLVKTHADYATLLGGLLKRIMPLGDKIMMRRQLLNFKKFAERDARAGLLRDADCYP